jgi:uncharacterized protein YecE (DUF72 family)
MKCYLSLMDFGRIELDLTNFNYQLPDDASVTAEALSGTQFDSEFQVYIGAAKWGNKAWVGKLYPPKTKDADFLTEYSKHFNTVELNTTFYGLPKPGDIETWNLKVEHSADFKFCPKFPQSITHIRRFNNVEDITSGFLEKVELFGDHLGPMFLQVADNLSPKTYPDLKRYLESLPKDKQIHIELRHKDWFSTAPNNGDIFHLLKDLHIGTVISDTMGRRDCVHMALTTPHAFVRFVSTDLGQDNFKRIDEWVTRFKEWKAQGLQSIYFFVHNENELVVPVLCNYLIKKLNTELGVNLKSFIAI